MSSARFLGALVLGPPRSGTTLLRRLIDGHPRICSPPELSIVSASCRFLREDVVARGVPIGPLSGLSYVGFGEDFLLDKVRQLVFDVYDAVCARAGKQQWVDKDGMSFAYLDEVEALFGDRVKYIGLVRHGLDTAVSIEEMLQRLGAFPGVFHQYVQRTPIVIEAAAELWRDVATRLKRFVAAHQEHVLLVRYEDLVADPQGTMDRVCGFLGESAGTDLIAAALTKPDVGLGDWKTYRRAKIDASSVHRWRQLPGHLLARLAPIVNPMLAAYGYETVTVPTRVYDRQYYRRVLGVGLGKPEGTA